MGTLAPKGFGAFDAARLGIEEAQVVVHKADQPDFLRHFLDADVLTGEDGAQVDFSGSEAEATVLSDGEGAVVERVFQLRQARIGSR